VNTSLKNSDDYLYAMIKKHRAAEESASPKIVFIGGSNLPFGLNSERISDETKMPVVDMGLHAGLGLKFMLEEAKPYIRKGDIVILVPEYQQFFGENYYGEETLVYTLVNIYPRGELLVDPLHRFRLL